MVIRMDNKQNKKQVQECKKCECEINNNSLENKKDYCECQDEEKSEKNHDCKKENKQCFLFLIKLLFIYFKLI